MAIHTIGARAPDGRVVRFFGTYSDEEFARHFPALPSGWLAWHLEPGECDEAQSERVKAIRELLVVHEYDRPSICRAVALGLTADEFFGRHGI